MTRHYFALVLFVCTLASCTKESMETANIVEAENIPEIEQELLEVVNQHRLSLGQNSLEFSSVAYLLANEHTDYMMTVGSLNHDNFSKRASTISTEVDAEFVAENVAKDYLNASEAFSGWLTSSSHKKTMEGEFTHTAVSVKRNEEGNLFYTQIFFR